MTIRAGAALSAEMARSRSTSDVAPAVALNVAASKVGVAPSAAAGRTRVSARTMRMASLDIGPPGVARALVATPYRGRPAQLPWGGVMVRRAVIAVLAVATVAAPAAAAPVRGQTLMPGVVYSRQGEFTGHGPVVLNIVSVPRPTGLYSVRAALSNGLITGRERLTDMEKDVSAASTVVGINGDYFNSRWGTPSSVLLRGGVLGTGGNGPPAARVDLGGGPHLARSWLTATWKGTDQFRPMDVNEPPGQSKTTLFTPAWGAMTPAEGNVTEVVLAPFPPARPNQILSAPVVQVLQGGGQTIPPDGAVLVARGSQAPILTGQAPAGSTVSGRLVLTPTWSDVVEAVGGGPALVRNGKPIFRSNELFTAS